MEESSELDAIDVETKLKSQMRGVGVAAHSPPTKCSIAASECSFLVVRHSECRDCSMCSHGGRKGRPSSANHALID